MEAIFACSDLAGNSTMDRACSLIGSRLGPDVINVIGTGAVWL
jgi:hypothetical protein